MVVAERRHAFVDLGQTRIDAAGRTLRICGACGRTRIGTGHRPDVKLTAVPDPEPEASAAEPATPQPLPVAPEPWPLALLRIACERVLEMDGDDVGWRLRLRVADVRAAMDYKGDKPLLPEPGEPKRRQERPRPRPVPIATPTREVRRWLRQSPFWPIARRALESGWIVERRSAHVLVLNPAGEGSFTLSTTNYDGRSYQNAKAIARRQGLNVEGL